MHIKDYKRNKAIKQAIFQAQRDFRIPLELSEKLRIAEEQHRPIAKDFDTKYISKCNATPCTCPKKGTDFERLVAAVKNVNELYWDIRQIYLNLLQRYKAENLRVLELKRNLRAKKLLTSV
jgi:hypothetical protein